MTSRVSSVLVLDAGGVLIAEPIPELLTRLAAAGGSSRSDLEAFYYNDLYEPLWSGALDIPTFWDRLLARSGAPGDREWWNTWFASRLVATPASAFVTQWARSASVFVLSNHRRAWIEPVLRSTGLDRLIDCLLVSEDLGAAKPDPRVFHRLLAALPPEHDRLLFIDDTERNVEAASALGIPSLLADPEGDWVQMAMRWSAGDEIATWPEPHHSR